MIKRTTWRQVDGDTDPGQYGGTIARFVDDTIELIEFQPLLAFLSEREVFENHEYPFWTTSGEYLLSDLRLDNPELKRALSFSGLDDCENLAEDLGLEHLQIVIACALVQARYQTEEGPSGWAADVCPKRVQWSTGKIAGPSFLGDVEFKRRQKNT